MDSRVLSSLESAEALLYNSALGNDCAFILPSSNHPYRKHSVTILSMKTMRLNNFLNNSKSNMKLFFSSGSNSLPSSRYYPFTVIYNFPPLSLKFYPGRVGVEWKGTGRNKFGESIIYQGLCQVFINVFQISPHKTMCHYFLFIDKGSDVQWG